MKEKILEYFTFTRKERLGVVVLIIIILALFIIPYWIRRPPGTEDPEATRQFVPLIEKMQKDSSTQEGYAEKLSSNESPDNRRGAVSGDEKSAVPVKLFYFNPNEIGEMDWQRLGLSERQSRTLVHYTGKGGHFRSAADLEKIYGLSVADRERLTPFVRIPSADVSRSRNHYNYNARNERIPKPGGYTSNRQENRFPQHNLPTHPVTNGDPEFRKDEYPSSFRRYTQKVPVVIDINLADTSAWEQLPGIGEKLAARIVRFREKLGGFYSSNQVAETFGLPDSTFQKIKPWLKSDSVSVQRIDLNSVTEDALRQHPYIRWKLATVLLRYREQHGKFQSLDELGQVALLDAKTLERLRPYLALSK